MGLSKDSDSVGSRILVLVTVIGLACVISWYLYSGINRKQIHGRLNIGISESLFPGDPIMRNKLFTEIKSDRFFASLNISPKSSIEWAWNPAIKINGNYVFIEQEIPFKLSSAEHQLIHSSVESLVISYDDASNERHKATNGFERGSGVGP